MMGDNAPLGRQPHVGVCAREPHRGTGVVHLFSAEEAQHGEAKIRWDRMMKTVRVRSGPSCPPRCFPRPCVSSPASRTLCVPARALRQAKPERPHRLGPEPRALFCHGLCTDAARPAEGRDILFTDKVHPILLKPSAPIAAVRRSSSTHGRCGGLVARPPSTWWVVA